MLISITIDTGQFTDVGQARIVDELNVAMEENEGITIETGGGSFFVDVASIEEK